MSAQTDAGFGGEWVRPNYAFYAIVVARDLWPKLWLMQFWTRAQWQARRAAHLARLAPFIEEHRARRSRREKHPVWDFLWEYYGFRPALLLRWSPGLGVELEDGAAQFAWKETASTPRGVALDARRFPRHRLDAAREIARLLEATAAREPFHGCFGLHEWAMVYRGQTRHPHPLRLSDDALAAFVESQSVRCSHYDAFRFFTPAARPLNALQPAPDDRAAFEQPGCIHANMDLYKWASKFYPWIGSDLIADAFELARDARWLDMRAAPYDLCAFKVEPIRLETPDGRRHYAVAQRQIAARAAPLRARVIEAYRGLIQTVEASPDAQTPAHETSDPPAQS